MCEGMRKVMIHSILGTVDSKVPARFLVGNSTNKSAVNRTNLPKKTQNPKTKKRFGTYHFRDSITEAMTMEEPWRMRRAR